MGEEGEEGVEGRGASFLVRCLPLPLLLVPLLPRAMPRGEVVHIRCWRWRKELTEVVGVGCGGVWSVLGGRVDGSVRGEASGGVV